MSHKQITYAAVYLLITQGDAILLGKRSGSGFMDGHYSLPAGHIDGGESAISAAIREAKEEVNIQLTRHDLQLVLTMHRNSPDREYLDLYFKVLHYQNEIHINEPHKCTELLFCHQNDLPEKTIPYVKQALFCIEKNISYIELGWN